MQLSEAEREVLTNEANSQLPKPSLQWLGWTDALYRLWLLRSRIARWTLLGFIIAIPAAIRYPKFESTVQIMPPDNSNSGLSAMIPALSKSPNLIGLAGDLLGAKSTGAIFIKILQSRTVQDDLIQKYELRQRYNMNYWEDARKKLGTRTTIADDKKSGVISISVRDRDAAFAATLANAYVDELDRVTSKVSTSAAHRERIFIEGRLKEEMEALQNAEQQFSQFASGNMALDVPQQTRVMVEAAARLQGELIATRAQLEGLKETYTAENIRVKSVQAHLNELERELVKLNGGRTDRDPSNPYPSVKSLPLLGVKWADLYRDTKIRETVVELLTQQYEMSKIQEAKEIPTVKVLDAASIPERKRPGWMLVELVGGLVAMMLACLSYFIIGWWERWDRDDPKRMLIAQVLQSGQNTVNSVRHIFQRRREPEHMSQL